MTYDSETVAMMNKAQSGPGRHPFTCMRQGDGCTKSVALIFDAEGWACPCGKYVCHGGEPTPAAPGKTVLEAFSFVYPSVVGAR